MTLKQLQDIIDYSLQQATNGCAILDSTTDCPYDSAEYVEQQLKDLNAIKQHLENVRKLYDQRSGSDTWQDEVHILTASDLCSLLNIGLYDFYGECYRKNNNQPLTSEEFISAFRNSLYSYDYEHFTDEMIGSGWQVIADLYEYNECANYNDILTGHFIQQ